MDSPFHRCASGKSLTQLPLERLAEIPAVVVRAELNGERAIDLCHFPQKACAGQAVLVQSGLPPRATKFYFDGHPYLAENAARRLQDCGAVLVGIDSLNIDSHR